ncbi:MAG TPA: carboxypeptidase regulatory-like domain-containing protein [Vicinamibacterales bacterium]|nr:carboxypeptidase regulatory-like domain-containing protein [Vicinamibacterales bacterium]
MMRARSRWRLWAMAAWMGMALASPARAQDTGTVSGAVVDAQGAAIPGATITLTDEKTATSRTMVSDAKGEFTFRSVIPGSYTVNIALTGFRSLEKRNNVVNASAAVDLGRLKLDVGNLTEVVTVEATGTHVETRNSDYTGLLTSTQIAQIQTKGRDVMSLLRLLPGVRYEDDIEAMGESFGSQVPNIGGQRRAWNQVTVDGLNGNELSGTNRFASATNLDAIAEVRVLLGSYKAEDGRSGGANVKVITKSGGQHYSGTGYYYARRNQWNANTWDNKRNNLPTPVYHYDTYGVSVGGPLKIPGLFNQSSDRKLFFFYSMENPRAQQPGGVRKYMMPTALERQGDFSQTLDASGKLIVIKDPLTGQPFLGNVIPKDRLNPNGIAIMNLLPLPNRLNRGETAGLYNFIRQETPEKPRLNNVAKIDWRRTANDNLSVGFNSFISVQKGSEITAGPEKFGYLAAKYDFGNNFVTVGHHHIFGANLVNELYGGVRRQTEGFGTATDADLQRILRKNMGFDVGQFHPELNPLGIMPLITLGLGNSGSGVSNTNFTYDQRLGETDHDWLSSATETLTWLKGNHAIKTGAYLEYMRNNEARGGLWMGQFNFSRNTNNPLDTNYAFSNLLLGVFGQYDEVDAYRSTRNRHWQTEWYAQDTWRARSRLTVDYGMRFLWYTPYFQANKKTAAFVPDRYDPAKAPRLYYPALVNGKSVALDRVTGQVLDKVYVGTFVPGTGVIGNGMVTAADPNYPRGFRDQQPVLLEPRAGIAYDLFGNSRSKIHASAGVYHNAVLGGGSQGNLQGPPTFNQSTIFFNTLDGFMAPGATLSARPTGVNGLDRTSKTPVAYRFSTGLQQEIGWGTVVDISYVGALNRYLEMQTNINYVPDGAKFVDLHPENVDPTNGKALPDDFLRPYRGYQAINIRGNWGTANYNSLQLSLNRRYSHGLQFGAAYTYAHSNGIGDDDPATVSLIRPLGDWYYGPVAANQRHNLTINYTYELVRSQNLSMPEPLKTLFGNWQLSGENAWVSGDWDNIDLSTTDNFDFTGGSEGARVNVTGDPRLSRSDRSPDRWFDTSVFARPAGRGDFGNEGRSVIQLPGINNWNLTLARNVALGRRSVQFRAEAYNVLNTLQFKNVDRGAKFDAAGNQVNANFGRANSARNPRIMQAVLRFTF